jgi:hypothetical protein
MFSWLRRKKPGPGVGISFTGFQVFMSMTSTWPSFRLGLASTVVPCHGPVPGDARAQVRHAGQRQVGDLARTSRFTTCAPLPSREAPITWL